ncbi:MAG: filamentous hemagglutinin N-terminal domain-containing protein, partial [Cohaesibacteraceae bacterium]|nr:filamentous hemagglutinin N-terminal domain-containing protein [Cohaesibacteraceae bacterium]
MRLRVLLKNFTALSTSFSLLTAQMIPAMANALPEGGSVVAGSAVISAPTSSSLLIDQSSTNAIINWNGFSIGSGNSVHFNNGSGATLNRVTGSTTSMLDGTLTSTGSLFLINQNGIIVGKDGIIKTGGGFVASTLDTTNEDFLNGGDNTFTGNSAATITNLGKVTSLGGDVAFIAHSITNEGDIEALNGTVGLAVGREILLRDAASYDGRFAVRIGSATSQIQEKGTIKAAIVELRANGGNIYALAGNRGGTINATGASKRGGRIFLTAGSTGTVTTRKKIRARRKITRRVNNVSRTVRKGGDIFINADVVSLNGLLDASGTTGAGGSIDVGAHSKITLAAATLNASGETGGGRIRVGGEYQGGKHLTSDEVQNVQSLLIDQASVLHADGTGSGANGGTIIAWADKDTDYFGLITAIGDQDGGFAEISGKVDLTYHGLTNMRGLNGENGSTLLDPTNFLIDATTAPFIVGGIAGGNFIIQTQATGTDAGDINVNSAINYSGNNSLTLLAHRNINANASIKLNGAGELSLVAGWDGTTSFDAVTYGNADLKTQTIFGNNSGSLVIGDGKQTTGITVGSKDGHTRVYTHDLGLTGGTTKTKTFAQLGYTASITDFTASSSNISVRLKGGILAAAGRLNGAFVKLGHSGSTTKSPYSGDIRIEALEDIIFSGGTGGYPVTWAQIGHGGARFGNHKLTGNISIIAARHIKFTGGTRALTFSQLGHGGHNAKGTYTGDISINSSGDISFTGGFGISQGHLGHGGVLNTASRTGNITITTTGNLTFKAGYGNSTYSQLGHGGNHSTKDSSGDITVSAGGNIDFLGGAGKNTLSLLGHGGFQAKGKASGNVTILSAVDLNMKAGSGSLANAMLGHTSKGDLSGNINVKLSGEVSLQAGKNGKALLGHTRQATGTITNSSLTIAATGIDQTALIALKPGDQSLLANDLLKSLIESGHVTIKTTRTGLLLDGPFVYNSDKNLALITSHDLILDASETITNAGTGNIALATNAGFINNSGSTTPLITNGRFLVYSKNEASGKT